ncbi:MAG TPA: PadR family transcriptional regulator [Ktedonobacteraceae bacterium]|nr:PadR family transcriptional regulator [Ktedonobacteraceae bacterium]
MHVSEPAEYAILGLLEGQPMHGYEMFQQFESGMLGEIVHLEMSQMYAFLKKLERLHYIESQLELQGTKPPRKVFHLTAAGREVFFRWLTQPVEKPREVRILFLIKLYFVRRFLPEQTRPLIDRQIIACQQFLDHLEARQHAETLAAESVEAGSRNEGANGGNSDTAFFDHVVLRGRIYQTRSLLDWLGELQRELAIV